MLQQQERAEKFFRAIRRDAERRRKEITEQIDSYIAAETAKTEAEETRLAQERVKFESERIQAQTNSRIAKATIEISAELAQCRSKITEDVFGQTAEKLKAFTQTEEYAEWLKKGLQQMSNLLGEDMVIYAREEDVKLINEIAKENVISCTAVADNAIVVGGVRAEKGSKKIEDTLDSRLKSQEDWFYQNSGLSIAIQ